MTPFEKYTTVINASCDAMLEAEDALLRDDLPLIDRTAIRDRLCTRALELKQIAAEMATTLPPFDEPNI